MFPIVYGFSWTPLHIIFLSIFFAVVLAIGVTLAYAGWKARRDIRNGQAAAIEWHSAFEDLPARDRACRHELTGEFRSRQCDRAFDCSGCAMHVQLLASASPAPPQADEDMFGLRYPADRFYHRGHTWVKAEPDGVVTVGPDDLSLKMFGDLEQVELPPVGTKLHVNGTAWVIRQNGDQFRVLSPVEGEVVEQGGLHDGFYLRITPLSSQLQTAHLLRGNEVRAWVMRELERLQILVSPDPNMPALADGGTLVDNVPAAFPQVNWPAVWGEMLLEP